MVVRPYYKDFNQVVCTNILQNYPVTTEDIANRYIKNGPNISPIKGNMTHNKPIQVVTNYSSMSENVSNIHRGVALIINVVFLNKPQFAVSVAQKIKFTM